MFRTNNLLRKFRPCLDLVSAVKVFAYLYQLDQKAVFVQSNLIWLWDSLQHVKEGRASQQRLETHIHKTVNLLKIWKSFIRLVKLSHWKVNSFSQFQQDVISNSNEARIYLFYNDLLTNCSLLLILLIHNAKQIYTVPIFRVCLWIKWSANHFSLFNLFLYFFIFLFLFLFLIIILIIFFVIFMCFTNWL